MELPNRDKTIKQKLPFIFFSITTSLCYHFANGGHFLTKIS